MGEPDVAQRARTMVSKKGPTRVIEMKVNTIILCEYRIILL